MSHLKTNLLYDCAFPPAVVAFTTNQSIDFTQSQSGDLNQAQGQVLSEHVGRGLRMSAQVRQVHGADVIVVDKADAHQGILAEADGLLTQLDHVALLVRTADCLPILLYDNEHQAIGILHAGWQGTKKGIVAAAFSRMKARYHTNPSQIKVALGPAIRSCCYQVGPEFMEYFKKNTSARQGHFYFDLVQENKDLLIAEGVHRENIFDCQVCTCCDTTYYSYRRDGEKAGRMLSVIMKGK